MQSNRQFWEEQGEAWKPMSAKDKNVGKKKKKDEEEEKAKKEPNLEAGEEDAPLLVRKGNWRNHYVNGHGFTVGIATFAVFLVGSVLLGASMLVSGTAKEVQELAPAPKEWQSAAYGAKHSGVGFANYVVGNAVSSFWNKEMGKNPKAKMTDPFASFLLKKAKKGEKDGAESDETPEQQADDAQPVDEGKRGRTMRSTLAPRQARRSSTKAR